MSEFNKGSELDKQIYKEGEPTWGCKSGVLDVEDVKEFIKLLEKEVMSAVMYADMEEDEFWATSLINKEEAQKRAQYYIEFMNFILNLAGDKLK